MLTKNCMICSTLIEVRHPSRFERTKTCSRPCAQRWAARGSGISSSKLARKRREPPLQPDGYRLVPLTKGALSKVDVEDYSFAMQYHWTLTTNGYARRTLAGKNIRLHRLILERLLGRSLLPKEQADHINGDRLDNRRSNLRVATAQQNLMNARRVHELSGYRGIWRASSKAERYTARVVLSGQRFGIGTFDSKEEGAWMYDQWALALHGEFAVTNFSYSPTANR